jgi:hypothetical protein
VIPDPAFQVIPDPDQELSTFFYFSGPFLSIWIQIRIANPDTDPGTLLNPNPDSDPQHWYCFIKKERLLPERKGFHTRQYVGPFTSCLSMVDLGRNQYQAESQRNEACARRQDIMKGIPSFFTLGHSPFRFTKLPLENTGVPCHTYYSKNNCK